MEVNGVKIEVPKGMEPYIIDGEVRFRKNCFSISLYTI